MPIITVKVFAGELTGRQTADLIHDLTVATIPYVGEAVQESIWVLVEEIKSGSWGIGGKAFGLSDLRRIQQRASREQRPGKLRRDQGIPDEEIDYELKNTL